MKKIIIVEDDKLLAIVLEKMAKIMNFEVLGISRSGIEAIRLIRKKNPDLIFMDIYLDDDINGIEAMKQLRQETETPVIYITAQSDPNVRDAATEINNSYYMLKPIQLNDLRNAVENFLSPAA